MIFHVVYCLYLNSGQAVFFDQISSKQTVNNDINQGEFSLVF